MSHNPRLTIAHSDVIVTNNLTILYRLTRDDRISTSVATNSDPADGARPEGTAPSEPLRERPSEESPSPWHVPEGGIATSRRGGWFPCSVEPE